MAWDATRPIPWQRLLRDWLIYVGIMAVVFAIALRDDLSAGPFLGLLASGPIFLVIGGVLAKFGYQRKTLKDLRAETAAREAQKAATRAPTPTGRARPAPTKRTSTGPSRGGKGSPNKAKRR